MATEREVFYEDLKVGSRMRHRNGRTLTDVDNIWFSLLTCNTNQIHFNIDYATKNFSRPPFNGRLLVNAFLTLGTVVGLSVDDTSRNGIMLGLTDLKVLNPVFAGDTLYAESTVLSKRVSKKHGNMGIVRIRTTGIKQDGTQVIEFERTIMVRKRGRKYD